MGNLEKQSSGKGRFSIQALRQLLVDRRGVGAVEFAFVAPILLILYIGSLEVSVAMSVNKKMARAALTVADLVTQRQTVDEAFLQTMIDVAESVISPYTSSDVKIKVTGVAIDGTGTSKVDWSWDQDNNRPHPVGTNIEIPNALKIPNSYIVRTEVNYDHTLLLVLPGSGSLKANNLNMGKTYHLRPRISNEVSCSNC